jgi:hypothetical protein
LCTEKVNVRTIQEMEERGEIITLQVAYDFPKAKQINDAGIEAEFGPDEWGNP